VTLLYFGRLRLKCDGTRAETIFRLSAQRKSPFKSAGRQFSRLLSAEVYASAVVILDTPSSGVVWRVMATHSIRQFPLHFPAHASPCAITFQLPNKAADFHNSVSYLCLHLTTSHLKNNFSLDDHNSSRQFAFRTRTAPFWVITQRVVVICYPLFGTIL